VNHRGWIARSFVSVVVGCYFFSSAWCSLFSYKDLVKCCCLCRTIYFGALAKPETVDS
jgi:hypothetical protein